MDSRQGHAGMTVRGWIPACAGMTKEGAVAKAEGSVLVEALQAAGLEGASLIAEVQRAVLQPGDLIVFRCEDAIRPEFEVFLRKMGRRLFPGHEVIVLSGGVELQVVSEAAVEDGE